MANSSDGEVAQIFSKFDKNGDGKLSAAEISEVLVELGCATTPGEICRVMDDIDKDKDGYIDLHEFTEFFRRRIGRDDEEAEIREAFDMYDLDGNGLISASELQAMMTRLGEKHSLEECAAMIKNIDTDGDGNVSFAEFKMMMTR
ncbi:hypothetical protein HN51_010683 [Arachis hypogaea]|uniref:EF-hand domain-containing protein n=2 Tax=Arachis TaxID=3817 RepID=A0A445E2A8_ARAHY|nr:calcium-binding allergen Ole e 8 [Arachis duranensis]XP_025686948.1 calcium-binding allergen Ole e 8 [Arachis hypogaea]XP_057752743.1 calcium-binding allergen Ole e 8-like [Arachis stenosperma]QHO55810.1 Calcium-binding allergen Ole e [Arachis hypogaea]RYR69557.1 hypothetical protein Ahy_A03g016110 [Arachis hypogaea]